MNLNIPGYYINENDNLVLLYPKGYNKKFPYKTQIEVYTIFGWQPVLFSDHIFDLLNKTVEFAYIGEL